MKTLNKETKGGFNAGLGVGLGYAIYLHWQKVESSVSQTLPTDFF